MQFLQKHPSKVSQIGLFGLLIFMTCFQVMAQKPTLPTVPTMCDYTTSPVNIMLSVGAEPSGFSKNYLLVDMTSGAIIATNATAPTFLGVPQGIYYATTAYYTLGSSIHNDVVGKLVSEVYMDGGPIGSSLKYADAVGIKVCTATCDYNTAPATLSFTASPSPTLGVSTTYALVDETSNKIIQTSTTASFVNVPVGDYSVVGVYFTGALPLTVGDTLYQKTTNNPNCVGVSNTIHLKVCSSVCLAGITAPDIMPTTVTNTCPTTTVGLAGLANAGSKPSGTTLIWSTHKLPTSSADSLTNTTTVITTGKYYALYFDKVNNCYSPADSVQLTNTVCNATISVNNPPTQTANINVPKSGKASTDLTPTGGNGTYVYSVDNSASCTPIAGATALPAGSNLTVTNSTTGTYNYTAPAIVGTYYYCIKVCDTNTPTPSCITKTYTLTITNSNNLTNTCPNNFVNLMIHVDSTNKPVGAVVTWHTSTPATLANKVAQPTSIITAGTYYAVYYDNIADCYGSTGIPVKVTINSCPTIIVSNICPLTTVNLMAYVDSTNKPAGATITWHTGTPATAANLVSNPTAMATSGMYYVSYYDVATNYSPTSTAISVTILECTACPNPIVIATTTTPSTCGGADGMITLTGLTALTNYTINYQKDGGADQSAVVISDISGKAIISNLSIGSYTNIQVTLPCKSNKVATTIFSPASCISPIFMPQDSTITVCTPLANLSSNPNTTATACAGYPKVVGAMATVAIVGVDVCITYKPKPGYVGTDSVCVTLCEPSTSVCTAIKIPVTVQPVPLAINDINITLVNTPVTGSVATNDKKTANTDSFVMITPPLNAQSFVLNSDGTYSYVPNPDFVGQDSVQYQVCSNLGNCSKAWLYITVYGPSIAVNARPIAQNDVAQTNMSIPVLGNLGSNDFDPEKGPLTFSTVPVTTPKHGIITINPNGTYTYTPMPGYIGTDTFKYQVCDELNQCTTAEVTVYIGPDANGTANDAPNAEDDSYRTPMNVSITANIRLNDSDPNGNTLVTTVVSGVSHGTLALTATGGMTYTPIVGFYGNDSFTYKACDPSGLCDTATIYLVVEPPLPIAQNDINITLKDTPVSGNILTNDNGGGLALTLNTTPIAPPSNGIIIINLNGTYTYTPNAGFVGTDSIRYVVCSASMVCDTAWLKIKVIDPKTGVNNPPVANDDVAQTLKNVPVSGKVTNNDIDPDGNTSGGVPLTASVVKQPDNGTLTFNPDGTFTYTPNPNFTGKDKFQYQVCDNAGACDTACVVITITPDLNGIINDKPNAQDDAALTNINIKITGSLKTNDTDPNGNNLTYTTTPIRAPAHGIVAITAAGSYTYTPATGFYGTDQFTYKVCDAGTPTLCDTTTVYIVVLSPTPDAQNDINVTLKNKSVTGNTATNDAGNGIPFTTNPVLVVQPVNGTLVSAVNGNYTYTPALNYVGKDSAQYVICNTANKCDSAWIYMSIILDPLINGNNAPIAQKDVAQTLTSVPVSGKVTNNDLDPDGNPLGGVPLTASIISNPTHGLLVFNPDGTFTYTPDIGFVGTDKFCYKLCDPSNACDTACVTITVSPDLNGTGNDKPNAQDDADLTTMNTAATGQLKPNDSDPNVGQIFTYTSTPVVAPMHGTVTINPTTGQFVYTPTSGYTGADKFLYKVCDNGVPSLCDTATVYLTVVPSTKLPDAINDITLTFKNTPVSGSIMTNDNPNDFVVATSLIIPAKNGTLTLLPNGTYIYVPNANYIGKDSARYVLCNTINVCDTAWISINVMPYPSSSVDNNKPIASNDVVVTNMNVPVAGSVGNNDFDPDITQMLTFTKLIDPTLTQGSVTFNPDGTYTFTPTLGFVGNATFKYKVYDSGTPVKCDTASVTIEVKPQSTQPNDKPVANDDAFVTYKGVGINRNAAPNDSDPNGNSLAFMKLTNPTNGTVIMNANGTFSYAPNATFIGTDSFTYKICDNGTPVLCDTATVYLTVLPPKQTDATKPDAVNDIAMTLKDTPVSGNVLTNDDLKGNPLVVGLPSGTAPKHGVIIINPDGSYTYTPTRAYVGKDSVRYVICVNEIPLARCDSAYIYFNIMDVSMPQNDKPVANNDVASTPAGTPVLGNVLNNDVDPDLTDVLTATKLTNPAHGTITVNPNGSYTYTPTPGYVGKDYFTYKVCDNGIPVKCDSGKVEIDVTPNITPTNANTKPSAQDDALLTKINTPKSGMVALNDTDSDAGQTLVFSQLSNPAHGTITGFNPTTGAYTYTPTAGYIGNDSFKYKVCDNGTPVLCDTATVYASVKEPVATVCVNFNLKVMLEGPLNTVSGTMSNFLNVRGLLPGQTPVGASAVATPNGQPYSGAPWNYAGTEVMPIGGYATDVVDWVLISLRIDSLITTPTFRAAGLLHADGSVTFINPCFTIANGSYYILVEHRNHMGVMSDKKITITSGTLTYDFTTKDSYALTNPPSYGQKEKAGKYVMYAADHKKALENDNFDINAADSNLWKGQSGIFDRYMSGDYNFDADVNNADNTLWKVNNGRFSGVIH